MKFIPSHRNPLRNQTCSPRLCSYDDSSLIVEFPTVPRSKTMTDPNLKTISFSAEIDSVILFCVNRETVRDFWYNKKDYKRFHRDTRYDIFVTRSYGGEDEDDGRNNNHRLRRCCITGIQHVIDEKTIMEIARNKEMHKRAVIDEYFRQMRIGLCDPEALRTVSRVYSMACENRARSYALELAEEVVTVPE